VQSMINGDLLFDNIAITDPVINIQLAATTSPKEKSTELQKIKINELNITRPKINFSKTSDEGTLSFNWNADKSSSGFLHLSGINNTGGKTDLSVKSLGFYLSDFNFTIPGRKTFESGNGSIAAQVRDAGVEQQNNQPLLWNAVITNLKVNDFQFDSIGKSTGSLVMNNGKLKEFKISSSTIHDLQKLVGANPAFQLHELKGHYIDAEKSIWWYNGGFDRVYNNFSLDSFIYRHEQSVDSFLAKQKFQTDYITVKTGAIRLGAVDIDTYLKDSTLTIGTATIDNILFTDYKDKNLPFQAGIIKPLLVNRIKKIPARLLIDSVLISHSNIVYTEKGDKIKKTGTVNLSGVSAKLSNIKSFNHSNIDSLRIVLTGSLVDSIWTRIAVNESYTDTAGGFLMTVQMKPANATLLNPVLIPFSSAKIIKGYLDTLSMTAVGREYLATGEMKMLYHDLKIRILKDGDENKKSLWNSILNFIANSFVVHNKNTSRTSKVFFVRNRERSAINYLIKTALSGVVNSVGAKGTKKAIRNYKKEQRRRKLHD
jgi:hypothetical protein